MRAAKFPVMIMVWVILSIQGSAQDSLDKVEENGPRDQCINIVFLSEGYSNADMDEFTDDVKEVWEYLSSRQPWNRYRSNCNVYRIDVVSNESGIDNGDAGSDRDTYFDTEWNESGLLRISSSGQDRVYSMLNKHVPEYDIIMVLVNDSSYASGVAYGQLAMTSNRSRNMARIAEHEIGHSFAGLADEYDEYPGGEARSGSERYNATQYSDRALVKWKSWIKEGTPVPTPESSRYANEVGLFEGAIYNETGWFRPHYNSMMKRSGQAVGQVNREKLVLSIYEKLSPVISYEPENSVIDPEGLDELVFSLDVRELDSGPSLQIDWTIDGIEQIVEDSEELNIVMSELDEGIHTVTATIFDSTTWVRNDPDQLLKEVITWTVNNGPLSYSIVGSTVTITDCEESASGQVVVPATVEGRPVTRIGASAFRDCESLVSVILPDEGPNVTYIGPGSNWYYRKGTSEASSPINAWRELKFVEDESWTVGEAVIGYGDSDDETALSDMRDGYSTVYFRKIFSVSEDRVPDNLVLRLYIDDGAIVWINGTEVARAFVGDGIKGFDGTASSHEASWEEFLISDAEKFLVPGNNVVAVHGINRSSESSDFSFDLEMKTVPVMSSIADSAFRGCSGLRRVNVPDSVESIGDSAFYGCSSLESVKVPVSLTVIGDFVFYGCAKLSEVVIPAKVTRIGTGAFAYCAGLNEVTFATENLSSIDVFAFSGCSGLRNITFPDSLVSIGNSALRDCSNLTDIIFLGNAPSVGPSAFSGVPDRAWITYPSEGTGYTDPFAGVRSRTNVWGKGAIAIKSITYDAEKDTCDITWDSVPGQIYRVYYSIDLEQWVSLDEPITGQGNTTSERFSVPAGSGFYRIQRD